MSCIYIVKGASCIILTDVQGFLGVSGALGYMHFHIMTMCEKTQHRLLFVTHTLALRKAK